MAACNNGRYNAVDVLLRNGAEPNMQDYVNICLLCIYMGGIQDSICTCNVHSVENASLLVL